MEGQREGQKLETTSSPLLEKDIQTAPWIDQRKRLEWQQIIPSETDSADQREWRRAS